MMSMIMYPISYLADLSVWFRKSIIQSMQVIKVEKDNIQSSSKYRRKHLTSK
jgi:hypothetical protein